MMTHYRLLGNQQDVDGYILVGNDAAREEPTLQEIVHDILLGYDIGNPMDTARLHALFTDEQIESLQHFVNWDK